VGSPPRARAVSDARDAARWANIDRVASVALREAARNKRQVADLEAVDKAIAAEGGA